MPVDTAEVLLILRKVRAWALTAEDALESLLSMLGEEVTPPPPADPASPLPGP